MGSYLTVDEKFFESCPKPNTLKKLFFGLAFFHALIQERRKFGALGWNLPYEFNESDLRISVRQLRLFLQTYADVPFEALRYCTGEANYGGRVTDDKDRRCMLALLSEPYSAAGIATGFHFSPDGVYAQPSAKSHDEYLAYIRQLPLAQTPQVFGLHGNAAITKDMKETRELFEATLSTQSQAAAAGGLSQDELLDRLAEGILTKLPPDFDLEEAEAKFPVAYLESMNTVLVQELIRFNRLTAIVRSSLASLRKAIKGFVVMNAELEEVGRALMTGARPALWMKRSYPSLKPLAGYVDDLLARLAFFRKWIDDGAPKDFWLSGFFFTQAFLTSSLQNYARVNTIAIDQIVFEFQVLDAAPGTLEPPPEGVHVHGLFLEGARFADDQKQIAESEPKVLFSKLPMMWLRPIREADDAPRPHYLCPLYKTSDRRGTLSTTGHSTNFVMYLKLPSEQPQSHWVKRGVAALCQLDD